MLYYAFNWEPGCPRKFPWRGARAEILKDERMSKKCRIAPNGAPVFSKRIRFLEFAIVQGCARRALHFKFRLFLGTGLSS